MTKKKKIDGEIINFYNRDLYDDYKDINNPDIIQNDYVLAWYHSSKYYQNVTEIKRYASKTEAYNNFKTMICDGTQADMPRVLNIDNFLNVGYNHKYVNSALRVIEVVCVFDVENDSVILYNDGLLKCAVTSGDGERITKPYRVNWCIDERGDDENSSFEITTIICQ